MRANRWVLIPLLLLAWALRTPLLLANQLHPDEALYGTWGLLIAHGKDPWLATVPVYKPPLLPYLVASTLALFGNSEFALRSLGLAAGLSIVPLTAALAHCLYRDRWGAAAAAAGAAFSPLALAFSATAFTDPLMVALGLAACLLAARNRMGWAGLLAALSFATKQTGLVWAPLALGFGLIQFRPPCDRRLMLRSFVLAIGCFMATTAAVFVWDAARMAQGAESFWQVGIAGYGGLRLAWPQELWGRLRRWSAEAHSLFASPIVDGAILLGLPVLAWNAVIRHPAVRASLVDVALVAFTLTYLLFHWLWAFPTWDRYLLPLAPILSILLGRILTLLLSRLRPAVSRPALAAVACALCLALARPALATARGRHTAGEDYAAYDGIEQAAALLLDQPAGTVVYHHWLGWEYTYHLFDAPIYLAYWPTPAWLAQDVQAFGAQGPRYITFPSQESSARVERALAGVGYELEPVLVTTRRDGSPSFTVYRIQVAYP